MAKILLVDDDVDLAEGYQTVFAARGHEVRCAYSAGEARDVVKHFTPDAAVMDVMMETNTAGFELARELDAQFPELPMLLVTGIHEATDVPFRFEPEPSWLPVAKVIDKPVAPAELVDEVEGMLPQ
ncbi:MAG: response regulator transcription factor [Planctomycetota bacterium]